jgi:hypothetical protein
VKGQRRIVAYISPDLLSCSAFAHHTPLGLGKAKASRGILS